LFLLRHRVGFSAHVDKAGAPVRRRTDGHTKTGAFLAPHGERVSISTRVSLGGCARYRSMDPSFPPSAKLFSTPPLHEPLGLGVRYAVDRRSESHRAAIRDLPALPLFRAAACDSGQSIAALSDLWPLWVCVVGGAHARVRLSARRGDVAACRPSRSPGSATYLRRPPRSSRRIEWPLGVGQ
jgi:hypothetical protein